VNQCLDSHLARMKSYKYAAGYALKYLYFLHPTSMKSRVKPLLTNLPAKNAVIIYNPLTDRYISSRTAMKSKQGFEQAAFLIHIPDITNTN